MTAKRALVAFIIGFAAMLGLFIYAEIVAWCVDWAFAHHLSKYVILLIVCSISGIAAALTFLKR